MAHRHTHTHTHTTGENIRYSIKLDISCRSEIRVYPQSVPSNLTPDTLICHTYINVILR